MTYIIRIEEASDYKWLLGILERTNITKFDIDVTDHILRVTEAVRNATRITATSSTEDGNPEVNERKPRKKRGEAKELLPNLCEAHKTYGAKYAPRTACEMCWKNFKKYNDVSTYTLAKRKFERNHGALPFEL